VWLGTLSKDLVPGFRIGWIAADGAIVERLARVKKASDFQTPVPLQAAVAAFLKAGADRRVRRARGEEVTLRAEAARRALGERLPEATIWGGQSGNPLFWLILPRGVTGRRVAEAAARRGVAVAPGQDFDPRGEDVERVRLSVTRVERKEIERGSHSWQRRCGKWNRGRTRRFRRRSFENEVPSYRSQVPSRDSGTGTLDLRR
jgi:2-aminoadipate transaminase